MRDGTRHRGTRRAMAGLAAVACLALAAPTAAGATGTRTPPPSKVPSLPQGVTVQPGPGPGQLVVSWSPPAYDGEFLNRFGVPVPYVITDYDLKGVPKASWASCPDLNLTCTVSGLRSGHTYEIAVRAYNAKGRHSHYTAPVPGTPG
jgi:hypothetical protein